jgi:hypothetical protein
MRIILTLLFILISALTNAQKLPADVTMKTVPCTLAKGLNSYNFLRNNEVIGNIEPTGCNPSYFEETESAVTYNADFYMAYQKDTFATENEAIDWLVNSINNYYKPVVIEKWQTLETAIPHVVARYPENWSYKTSNSDLFFGSKTTKDNKVTIMVPVRGGNSEIFLIVRTPNTEKLSVEKAMEWTQMWIRALDFKNNPPKDIVIGGKTFKAAENTFMAQMYQHHYWYADNEEIIYINYNMLKEEQVWYPAVLEEILKSLSW